MTDDQLLRYSRHILLDELGIEGQQRLLASHALVIGAGGLGSPVALYLGTAGVGRLTIVDHDSVDVTNLQRQIAHNLARVGQPKAESARDTIAAINPDVQVRAAGRARRRRAAGHPGAPTPTWCSTAATTSRPATPSTRPASRIASRWCRARRSASTARSRSTTRDSPTRPATPACSRPRRRSRKCSARRWACSRRWSASSARCRRPRRLKLLAGIGNSLAGRLQMLDARTMEWNEIRMARQPHCARLRRRQASAGPPPSVGLTLPAGECPGSGRGSSIRA